ncbi:MAG: hypothetical protein AAF304_08415, partial [Pseudomonadota bacterium]
DTNVRDFCYSESSNLGTKVSCTVAANKGDGFKFQFDTKEEIKILNIEPGLFDYAWEINVCESLHIYRVVNEKGSKSFKVYPIKL